MLLVTVPGNMKIKANILLVEDDPVIATFEKHQLQHYDYSVSHVTSGETAVTEIENKNFDLILMDIDLGDGIDGTETAALILQKKDIPILFLSSHTEPEIVEKTESITTYGYVVKNTGITVLDASIKMALRLFQTKTQEKLIQKELEISEKRYRLLFEHITEEVHLWQVVRNENNEIISWVLIDANPAAIRAWEKSREETIGKRTEEIWPDADPVKIFLPVVQKIFAENKPHSWQQFFPGTGQTLLMTSAPFDEYFISTGMDITHLIAK